MMYGEEVLLLKMRFSGGGGSWSSMVVAESVGWKVWEREEKGVIRRRLWKTERAAMCWSGRRHLSIGFSVLHVSTAFLFRFHTSTATYTPS